jgi:peroxiredoxin
MKQKRLIIRTIILILIAAAIGYTIYSTVFGDQNKVVKAGDQAPNFRLETLEGESIEMADLEGKGVFLNFWGTYCKPCEREMPAMQRQYEIYKEKGIEIVAVNLGESNLPVKRFVERKDLTFTVLLDKKRDLVDVYGIGNLPATFLVDKNGRVVERTTGQLDDEKVSELMEKIIP